MIKKVLKIIIDAGFDAYIVGGYVRDFLLNKKSYDIDIATSASLSSLKDLFKNYKVNTYNISFQIDNFYFTITPYRIEEDYIDYRHPSRIYYTSSMEQDSLRRDFTMNAIYMDINGHLYDFYNGKNDILNHKIVAIGDCTSKMNEDPLRYLRMIRFMVTLSFDLDHSLFDILNENKDLLTKISYTRKKQELEKMYKASPQKCIDILSKYNLLSYFDLVDTMIVTPTIYGIFAQMKHIKYPLRREEKGWVYCIQRLLKKNITIFDLLECPSACILDLSAIYGNFIKKMYQKMPIHSLKEINFDFSICKGKSLCIGMIKHEIAHQILNQNLKNNSRDIYVYLHQKYNI